MMLESPMPWYVAFEGPIAAGKTTLAKLFANVSGARQLLEEFVQNEFLEDFYKNRNRWTFPMQLSFLLSRHEQFCSCVKYDVPIVSDHTYEKDHIFARLLLSDRELRLYERIRRTLNRPTTEPDLIVYLDAPNEVLLKRIQLRNRPYEKAITVRYLEQVREAYQRELIDQSNLRIINQDTSNLDLDSNSDMIALYDRILNSIPIKTT